MRKLLTKILSVIVALTAMLGLVSLPKTSVLASEENPGFGAVAGASVKYGDTLEETGLRFTIEVNREYYASLPSGVVFGALISTKNYVDNNLGGDLTFNKDDENIADVCYVDDASKFDADQPSDYPNLVYYASITYRFNDKWKAEAIEKYKPEMPNASDDEIFKIAKLEALSTDLVCRPYYVYEGKYVYSGLSDARSMVKVANSAVIDGDPISVDFTTKYLSTLVESESEVYIEEDGDVVGLSNADRKALSGASITADGVAEDVEFIIDNDKLTNAETFLANKQLGAYYYVTAFKGYEIYRIKYQYVTMAIDDANDLSVFVLTPETAANRLHGYYALANDIDATGYKHGTHTFASGGTTYPGSSDKGFDGTLDGNGHTIYNFYSINNGLFGQATAPVVKNISFVGATISGYYGTIFAHSINRDGWVEGYGYTKEALFENVYIQIDKVIWGNSKRVGILANNTMPLSIKVKNVVVEYTNAKADGVYDGVFALTHEFGIFGGSNNSDMQKTLTFESAYAITDLPIMYSRGSNPYAAENQVEHTISNDYWIASVGEILDSKYADFLTAKGLTMDVHKVARGLRYYDNHALMASDAVANKESLATFDSKYWVVINGVPYWEAIYVKGFDVTVKNNENEIDSAFELKDDKTVLTIDIIDEYGNAVETEIEPVEGLVVNGNRIKLATNPTSVGYYEVKATATVNGATIVKYVTINYSNEIEINDKIYYSQYDKALDLRTLNEALLSVGQDDITLDQITGYIVNGEEVPELDLEVLVTSKKIYKYQNMMYERTVDTAQQVVVVVNGKNYVLNNVYAYTRLIDEVEDLSWISQERVLSEDGVTYLYDVYDGYYLVTKNIDGTGLGEDGANYSIAGYYDGKTANKKSTGLKGVFDGNGYTISNMNFPSDGLFGNVTGGIVRNVAFKNINLGGYYPSLLGRSVGYTNFESSRCYSVLENIYVEGTTFPKNKSVSIFNYQAYNGDTNNVVVNHTLSEQEKTDILAGKQHGVFGLQGIYSTSSTGKAFRNTYVIGDLPIAIQFATSTARNNFVFASNVLKLKEGSTTEYEVADKQAFAFLNQALNATYTKNNYTWTPTVPTTDTLWTIDYMPYVKQYINVQAMASDTTNDYSSFDSAYWTIVNGVPTWNTINAVEHEHVIVNDEAVDPTCESNGLTAGKHCSVCGKVYVSQQVIPALGHKYGDIVSNEDGTHSAVCKNDNSHVFTENCKGGVATCTEKAKCEVCNAYYGEILPHEYKTVVTKPTCTEKGFTTYTCDCGDSYVDNYVDALGHKYQEFVTEPTCTEKGFTTYTCDCGDTYVDNYVDALGHAYGEFTSNGNDTHSKVCANDNSHVITENCLGGTATCVDRAVCEVCNVAYGETLSHEYQANVTNPTCEAQGYTTYTCDCGDSYVDNYVDAVGHAYGEFVSNGNDTHSKVCANDNSHVVTENCKGGVATCTEKAKCEICNAYYGEKLPHEYKTVVTKPTCTEKGFTTYTCDCGDSYIDNYVDALGHSYQEVVTKPTCEEKGFTTYTCYCGDSYVDNYVDAIGHAYGEFISNGNDTHSKECENDNSHVVTENCRGGQATVTKRAICEVCNHEYGDLLEHFVHTYNEQIISEEYLKSPATCDSKAVYYYACICGGYSEETFEYGEALGHSLGDIVSNGNGTHEIYCANDRTHKVTQQCSGDTPSDPNQPIICSLCNAIYAYPIAPEISFKRKSVELNLGEFIYLEIRRNDIPNLKVEYYSEDENVVTVDNHGRVKANYIGSTYVVAKYGSAITKCLVTVVCDEFANPVLIDLYGFNETYNLYKNTSFNFYPAVSFGGQIYTNLQATFVSTNENIAYFNGNTLITKDVSGSVDCYVEAVWNEYSSNDTVRLRFDFTVVIVKEAYLTLKDTSADYFELYTLSEFDGKTLVDSKEFIPEFYAEGEKINVEFNYAISDTSVIDFSGNLISAKKFGQVQIDVSCIYEGIEYVKVFDINVIRPEADYETEITNFSSGLGTFKDAKDNFIEKTITNKIYGNDSANIIEAYQEGRPLTIEDNKILGITGPNKGAYNTVISIATETEIYKVALKVYGLYITTAEDLGFFSKHFEFTDYYYVANDIDASNYVMPLYGKSAYADDRKDGGLKGVFEGNGHVISGLTVNSRGMFGGINGATIQNVAFTNVKLTGYYPCLIAHFEQGATKLKNMYVQIDSIAIRGGGLYQQQMSVNGVHENIIVEYGISKEDVISRIDSYNDDKSNISVISPQRTQVWTDTMFTNSFAISYAPIGLSSPHGSDFTWASFVLAENQITLTENATTGKTDVSFKDDFESQLITHTVFNATKKTKTNENGIDVAIGIKAYHTFEEMQADESANEEILKSFDETYWAIINGIPRWKALSHKEHEYLEKVVAPTCESKGYTLYSCTGCDDSYKDDYKDALGHNYTETVYAPTCFSNGYTIYSCERCNSWYVGDNQVESFEKHNYVNDVCTGCGISKSEERVLYSQFDKALDLATLKLALADRGVKITSLEDIDGYLVNGELTNELELEVIISNNTSSNNSGRNRAVDTAQTVTVVVNGNNYLLTNVYAYTKIIDDAEDLKVFTMKNDNQYNELDGYFIVTKNIDATKLVLDNHVFATGAVNPGNGSTADVGFRGVFDGQGHVIDGLGVKSNGLFGQANAPVIKNVAFTNVKLSGYYPTLLAHNISRGKTHNDSFTNIEGMISNVYVSVSSISKGTSRRVGILVNNTLPAVVAVRNVVVDYLRVSSEIQAEIDAAKPFYMFGSSKNSMVNATSSYKNVYSISTAPVLSASLPGFAENQVEFTLNQAGSSVIAVGNVIDEQVNEILALHGKTLTTGNVLVGLRAYDSYEAMALDSEANSDSLATFDSKYWTVVNGVPKWNTAGIPIVHEHNIVTDKGYSPTCTETGLTDAKTCTTCGKTLAVKEIIPALGHNYGEWIASSNGEYYRVCKNDSSHVIYAKAIEEKLLYSANDKALDLVGLQLALADLGVTISSLDDIDEYIVNDVSSDTLELDVIVSGSGVNATVEAQQVVIVIDGEEYVLPYVYAYTKVIDEASDLAVFVLTEYTAENRLDGYYILSKDIDATGYVHGTHTFTGGGTTYAGSKDKGFSGSLDGNGYTISNFTSINNGLFGQATAPIVKNIAFTNVTITGYYGTLFAHSINRDGWIDGKGYTEEALFENVYIQIDKVIWGASKRVGILANNTMPLSIRVKNVVVEYTNAKADGVYDKVYALTHEFGIFGGSNGSDMQKTLTFEGAYAITDLPVMYSRGTRPYAAENQVEHTISNGYWIASVGEIYDTEYANFLTAKGLTLDVHMVARGLRFYANKDTMALDSEANANTLATYSEEFWTIINGVPYWKHKHSYKVEFKDATCEENGVVNFACDCGDSHSKVISDALGHEYGEFVSNGNGTHSKVCVNDGSHVITEQCKGGVATCSDKAVCEDCGGEYGELLAHTYSEIVSNPTCDKQGYSVFYCDCGHKYIGNYVDALGHDYSIFTTNGDGTHSKVCANDKSHVVIEDCRGGHATETKKPVCELCNSKYGSVLVHSHNFTEQLITNKFLKSLATCESKAVYYYACDCGEIGEETFEYGKALGHAYGEFICNGNSTHSSVCANDSSHVITEDCYSNTLVCDGCGSRVLPKVYGTEGLEFEIATTKTGIKYAICTGIGTATDNEIIIPSHYQGYVVEEVAPSAFKGNNNITSIKFVYGMERIGMYAFQNCTELFMVYVSETVENIGYNAFGYCEKLLNVCNDSNIQIVKGEISNGAIGSYACNVYSSTSGQPGEFVIEGDYELFVFTGNKYIVKYNGTSSDLVFPEGTTGIYKDVFKGNKAITEITFPASLTYIGKLAFADCTSLTKVNFPKDTQIKEIGTMAFANCSALTEFNYGGSLESYLNITFANDTANPLNHVYSLDPDDAVAEYRFIPKDVDNRKTLRIAGQIYETLVIPEGVKVIKNSAFVNCDNIKTLVIASTVEEIEPFAFAYSSVEEIAFNGESNLKIIGNNAFANCINITKLNLPRSLEYIELQAFFGCKNLTSLVFEDNNNLQVIGQKAFFYCYTLESVFIGNNSSLKELKDECFYNCSKYYSSTRTYTGLKYFSFGNNSKVETIGRSAFRECKIFVELYIPKSCTSIGDYAFSGCFKTVRGGPDSLKIYAEATSVPLGWENNYNSSNCVVTFGVEYPTL